MSLVVLLRNAPGMSVFNPVEHVHGSLSIALSTLAVCRTEAKPEVESEIKRLGTIKRFTEEYADNEEYIQAYLQSMDEPRLMIEDTTSRARYSGNRIRISQAATDNEINDNINMLRNYFKWLPEDVRKCSPQDIFKSDKGKEWFNNHVKVGRYMTQIYRGVQGCSCEVCNIPLKNDFQFPGFIPYPKLMEDNHYSKFESFLPYDQYQDELECPSMNGKRLSKCSKNTLKLSTSTALFLWKCSTCSMVRLVYGIKKNIPSEYIEFLKTYLEDYEYVCGDPIFPHNDINLVDLPDPTWKMDKYKVEFRYNLTCTSLLEIQVDSFKVNNNVVLYCVYCSSSDIDPNNVVKGYRPMCMKCSESKAPVSLTSKKGNGKHSLDMVTMNNRTKRVRKQPEIRNDSATTSVTSSVHEHVTKETIRNADEDEMVKDFLKDSNLKYVHCEGLGDCCVQACMKAYFNRSEDFSTNYQKRKLSAIKWSLCNAVHGGRTLVDGNKYKLWRGKRIGDVLNSDLYMKTSDIQILAHMLNKQILVIAIQLSNDNGKKYLRGDLYVPRRGGTLISKEIPIRFENNNAMYYLEDRRKPDEKTYVHPSILIQHKTGIVIYHWGIHYDAMIDPSFGKPHANWPTPISYTIFNPSESDKLCPVCGIYSWGSDTVQCGLCLRWIHYDDESKKCDKYYEDINMNTLRENYFCKTCLDILLKYYKIYI